MAQVVSFYDGNPFNRRDPTRFNTVGFVTRRGIVKFPKFRKVQETILARILEKPHKVFEVSHEFDEDRLDEFFT